MNHITIKSAIRQLWKNKVFSVLNILGLSIGITSCWVIFNIVRYEYSYEKGLPQVEQTYRLITKFSNDGKVTYNAGVAKPIYQALEHDVPGIRSVAPLFRNYEIGTATVNNDQSDKRMIEDFNDGKGELSETNANYFDIVGYQWLAGSQKSAFANPDNVILTTKRADEYFPNQNYAQLIGKTIIYNDTIPKTISGVIANLDFPSEFASSTEFILLKEEAYSLTIWTNTNGTDKVYFQTEPGTDINKVQEAINKIAQEKWSAFSEEKGATYVFNRDIVPLSSKDSHFASYLNEWNVERSSKPVVYGMIGISIFLLTLACINYINLTTAQIPGRSKEIGVRKTLGCSKKQLFSQLILESLLIVCMAALLSFFLSKAAFFYFKEMIPQAAVNYTSMQTGLLFIVVLLLFTALISTLYPAWLMNKVQPVNIFRSGKQLQIGNNQINIRKVLIVAQFFVAQFFTVSALIIGQQLSYTLHKDLGFDKDAVVLFTMPFKLLTKFNEGKIDKQKKHTLLHELANINGVANVSLGTAPLTNNYSSSWLSLEDTELDKKRSSTIFFKDVDAAYLDVYDIKLIAGKNLENSDTTNAYVINESAAKAFGFQSPADALGKRIGQGTQVYPIVGVVKDFHTRDFYNEMSPIALRNRSEWNGTFNIKLTGGSNSWKETQAAINSTYSKIFPEFPMELRFYDEAIAAIYHKEQNLAKMVNTATAIAILIGCLGLFGLVTLAAFQRTKEIGIRKVLGASVLRICGMLSGSFVRLILISILLSSPLIWWAANKWLEDFVYRIELSVWPFFIGAFIALLAAALTIGYQAIKAARANPVDSLRDE